MGDWGLGIGAWGLGLGNSDRRRLAGIFHSLNERCRRGAGGPEWRSSSPQSPVPSPQSPVPSPHIPRYTRPMSDAPSDRLRARLLQAFTPRAAALGWTDAAFDAA